MIRLLNAKVIKPAEIHPQVCVICGKKRMRDLTVQTRVRRFSEERENVHDDEQRV